MNIASSNAIRPRVIVMTDFPPVNVITGSLYQKGEPPERYSDPDDVQSMVRLLMCSNDLEVEALIASAGSFANIAVKQHILDMLDVYEHVQPTLPVMTPAIPRRHSGGPDAGRTARKRSVQGYYPHCRQGQ